MSDRKIIFAVPVKTIPSYHSKCWNWSSKVTSKIIVYVLRLHACEIWTKIFNFLKDKPKKWLFKTIFPKRWRHFEDISEAKTSVECKTLIWRLFIFQRSNNYDSLTRFIRLKIATNIAGPISNEHSESSLNIHKTQISTLVNHCKIAGSFQWKVH